MEQGKQAPSAAPDEEYAERGQAGQERLAVASARLGSTEGEAKQAPEFDPANRPREAGAAKEAPTAAPSRAGLTAAAERQTQDASVYMQEKEAPTLAPPGESASSDGEEAQKTRDEKWGVNSI